MPPPRPARPAPRPRASTSTITSRVLLTLTLALAGCPDGDVGVDAGVDAPEPEPEPVPVGPTAVIAGATDGEAPLVVTVDASGSVAGDAPIASYLWTLDDAPLEDALVDGATATMTVLVAGLHLVGLTVTDEAGLSATTTVELTVAPEDCPSFAAPVSVGSLDDDVLDELSGLVAARKTPDVFFTHNDSGAGPYLFALTSTGTLIDAWDVTGASAFDWEDIASGPGPDPDEHYLYIADTGDNDFVRDTVVLYRVPEPVVDASGAPQVLTTARADVIELSYPTTRENVEGVLVDPIDGAIYLFTKGYQTTSRVYRAPAAPFGGGDFTLEQVATLDVNGAGASTPLITAVDVSALGNQIVVRTYTHLFLWIRPGGEPLVTAFDGTRCTLPSPNEPQGEAVAFSVDGRALLTASEGAGAPVYQLVRTD